MFGERVRSPSMTDCVFEERQSMPNAPQVPLQSDTGALVFGDARLRDLIERIPDVIWTADQSGTCTYISPNVERVLGVSPACFCDGAHSIWLDAIHPDDRDEVGRAYAALFEHHTAFSVEYRFHAQDGRWRWLHLRALSVYARDDKWYADGILCDITERKSAELLLRQSEERLKILIGCAKGIAFEFDAEGYYLNVWTNDESLLARPAKELIGRTVAEVLGNEFADPLVARIRRVLASGMSDSFEYSLDLPGGRRYFVSDLVDVPATDELPRVAMLIRDITELRAATESLRQSEERFRQLVEASPDAIGVGQNGVIRFANPAMAKLYGYDRPDELVGRPILDFVHPSEHAVVTEISAQVLSGKALVHQHRYLRRDGTTVEAEASRLPIEFEGAPAILGMMRDMTERKQLEARALSMDRLASMGRLAAGIGHEINNPLAFVIENLSLALEELEHEPRPDLVEMLRHAAEGADRIRRVVRELKTFSRSEDETRSAVDVESVIESSINMAFNEIRHRAELVRDFERMPPVIANRSQLGQVFLNLLVNAAQAIPEGRAAANRIGVRTRLVGDRVVAEVSDTGPGITDTDLPHIFEGFFTTKPVGGGTGLGLSISREIVTALGGTIEVETRVGQGSTFKVSLPAVAVTAPPLRSTRVQASTKRRGRILVIDDEPLVGVILRRSLGREHDVTVTSGARHALELLRKGEGFDAIVCDVMMPDITGMEFHEQLERELPALAEKVVFLTGGSFTAHAREFLDRTAQPIVEKPFDGQVLRALIRDRMDRADARTALL